MSKFGRRKTGARLWSLITAAAMVFSFCAPLSAFADEGGAAKTLVIGSEDDSEPAKGIRRTAGSSSGSEITLGVSSGTLIDAMDLERNVWVNVTSSADEKKTGEAFNIALHTGFFVGSGNTWPSYSYPGLNGDKLILSSVTNYHAVVTLPEGIEWAGTDKGIEQLGDGSLKIMLGLGGGTIKTGSQTRIDIPLRLAPNGKVPGGEDFEIQVEIFGDLHVVTQYGEDGMTPEATEDFTLAGLGVSSRRASCRIRSIAGEKWGVEKETGDVSPALSTKNEVTFSFKTGTGIVAGAEGNVVYTPSDNWETGEKIVRSIQQEAYDRFGRLFFDKDKFAVGETVVMYFTDDQGNQYSIGNLNPKSVRIVYDDTIEKSYGIEGKLPGEQHAGSLGGTFFTSRYSNWSRLNPDGGKVTKVPGYSPVYTAYTVYITFDHNTIANAVPDAISGESTFYVESQANLSYSENGQKYTIASEPAEQHYTIGQKGGRIRVSQYLDQNADGKYSLLGVADKLTEAEYPVFDLYREKTGVTGGPVLEKVTENSAGKEITGAWTPVTDVAGGQVFVWGNLDAGSYIVAQTSAPAGYGIFVEGLPDAKSMMIDGKPVDTIKITVPERQTADATFRNRAPASGVTLKFNKVREMDNGTVPAPGITFAAHPYNTDAEKAEASGTADAVRQAGMSPASLQGWVTAVSADKTGEVTFTNLSEGLYYLVEVNNPTVAPTKDYYVAHIGKDQKSCKLTLNGLTAPVEKNQIVNKSLFGGFRVEKEYFGIQMKGGVPTFGKLETYGQLKPQIDATKFELYQDVNGTKTKVEDKTIKIEMEQPAPSVLFYKVMVSCADLPAGDYYLKETTTGLGWNSYFDEKLVGPDEYIGPFTVAAGKTAESEKTIQNKPDVGGYLYIKKVGLADGATIYPDQFENQDLLQSMGNQLFPLKGAEFQLTTASNPGQPLKFRAMAVDMMNSGGSYVYAPNDAKATAKLVTGKDGVLALAGLEGVGTDFILTETKAPDGYTLPNPAPSVRLQLRKGSGPDGDKTPHMILNVKKGSLGGTGNGGALKKVDETGVALSGAEFEVYYADGKGAFHPYQVDGKTVTAKSGTDGSLTYTPPDAFNQGVAYYLHETTTPGNFVKPDDLPQSEKDALVDAKRAVLNDGRVLYGPYRVGVAVTQPIVNLHSVRAAFVLKKYVDDAQFLWDENSPSDKEGLYYPGTFAASKMSFTVAYDGKSLSGAYYNASDYTLGAPVPLGAAMMRFNSNNTYLRPRGGSTYVVVDIPAALVNSVKSGDHIDLTVTERPCVDGEYEPETVTQQVQAIVLGPGDKLTEQNTESIVSFINLRKPDVAVYKRYGEWKDSSKMPGGAGWQFKIHVQKKDGSWEVISAATNDNSMAPFNNLPLGEHYYLEEVQQTGYQFAGIKYGDATQNSGVITGQGTNQTVRANGTEGLYDITDFVKKIGLDSAGSRRANLFAYNLPSAKGEFAFFKKELGTEKAVSTEALKIAKFDVYEILIDENNNNYVDPAHFTEDLSNEQIASSKYLKLLTDYSISAGYGGKITVSGLKSSDSKSFARYLVVETAPPDGYTLREEAYDSDPDDSIYAQRSSTRLVVGIRFGDGLTVSDKYYSGDMKQDGVGSLYNAPFSSLNVGEAKAEVIYTAPLTGGNLNAGGKAEITSPLEFNSEGEKVSFEVANHTTISDKDTSVNMIPLRDFTVEVTGLQYLNGEVGEYTEASESNYALDEVLIPLATGENDTQVEPHVFVNGGEIQKSGSEDVTLASGGSYTAWRFALGGAKSFRVLYGSKPEGKDYYEVGRNFMAPTMIVNATFKGPSGSEAANYQQVRAVRADAHVTYGYEKVVGGEIGKAEASANAIIPILKEEGFPTVTIQKAIASLTAAGGRPVSLPSGKVMASTGDKIGYRITLKNTSDKYAFEKPILIDRLPEQVQYDAGSLTLNSVSFPVTPVSGSTADGFEQQYLPMEIGKALAPGGQLVVEYTATVRETAILMQAEAHNYIFVTSAAPPLKPTVFNPNGWSFRGGEGELPEINAGLMNALGWRPEGWQGKAMPTLEASVSFERQGAADPQIYQYIKGEYEFVNENTPYYGTNQIAVTTRNGRVQYRVTITNGTKSALNNVRFADMLPLANKEYNSFWAPTLIGGTNEVIQVVGKNSVKDNAIHVYTGADRASAVTGALGDATAATAIRNDWSGWAPLSEAETDTRSYSYLDGTTSKAMPVYENVTAVGFEFADPLGAGDSVTFFINMIAPNWSDEELREHTSKLAVNQINFTGYRPGGQIVNGGDQLGGQLLGPAGNLVQVTVQPNAGVGNYVWLDKNRDGIANDGTGIGGVEVTLTQNQYSTAAATEPQKTATLKTTTGSDGSYNFNSLIPWTENGFYSYQLTFPSTLETTKRASDPNPDDNDSNGLKTAEFRFIYDVRASSMRSEVRVGSGWKTLNSKLTDGNIDNTFDCGYVAERTVTLLKSDLFQKPLGGASFGLFEGLTPAAEAQPVLTASSEDATGLVSFQSSDDYKINLTGDYSVRELKAPIGYQPSDATLHFEAPEVTGNQTFAGIREIVAQANDVPADGWQRMINYPTDVGLTIDKTVIDPTAGAAGIALGDTFQFTLYSVDENGAVAAELGRTETFAGGKTALAFLNGGKSVVITPGKTYAVRETVTNKDTGFTGVRYNLSLTAEGVSAGGIQPIGSDGAYSFTVADDATTVHLTADNTLQTGKVSVRKALLEGQEPIDPEHDTFTFTLYPVAGNDENGNPQIDLKAGIESDPIPVGGDYSFNNLPLGRYALIESGMSNAAYQFVRWGDSGATTTIGSNSYLIVTADGQSEASFLAVNTVRDGSLAIAKTITGGVRPAERNLRFTFDIYRAQESGESFLVGGLVATTMVSPGAAGSQTVGDLAPGYYAVTERAYSGYLFNRFTGDGQTVVIDGTTYFIVRVQGGQAGPVSVTAQNDPPPPPPPPVTPDIPDIPDIPNIPDIPDEPFGPDNPGRERTTYTNDTPDLVTIDDEQVPLAQSPLVTIPDEPIPLAGLPDAGGMTPGQLIPIGLLLAVAGFWLTHRKRGPNSK